MTTPITSNYNAMLAAQNYSVPEIKQPKGGAGEQNGTKINPFAPEIQKTGRTEAGGAAKHAQELNEVSNIGFAKKAGFENGLGGTNHPVDANGRFCKTWVA